MFNQFEQATVYKVWALVKTYNYDQTEFLGHYPTEDLAKLKVDELNVKAEAKLQTYLDKYDRSDSSALYEFYKELCEAEDWPQAEAVYEAFADSDVSYDITMQYVETPIIIESSG